MPDILRSPTKHRRPYSMPPLRRPHRSPQPDRRCALRAKQLAAGFGMDKDYLTLKRASASRPSGAWNDDDFDVLADATVVDRIMKVHAAPEGSQRMWTLALWTS